MTRHRPFHRRPTAHLLERTSFKDDVGTELLHTLRSYELNRDLLDSISNWKTGNIDPVSKYKYVNDSLGRRDYVVRTGTAFAGSHGDRWDNWVYNDRHELVDSKKYLGATGSPPPTTQPVNPETYNYVYDDVGNRETSQVDVSPNQMVTTYTSNELNQYQRLDVAEGDAGTPKAAQLLEHDPDGNRQTTQFLGDMNCDGEFNNLDTTPFLVAVLQGCAAYDLQYPNCDCMRADMNGDGVVNSFDLEAFSALLGSSAETTPHVNYIWDAENRLTELGPGGSPVQGDVKLEYVYDYLGRRVERKVSTWNATTQLWDLTQRRKFVWAGWLLLMELEPDDLVTPTTDDIVREYTWGLDLSGQGGSGILPEALSRAGGIGGLPFGWRLAGDGVQLVAVESEQTIIRDIRAMRTAGKSYRAIAGELTERGIPTKKGNGRWTHTAVAGIVKRTAV